ncbi:enediyne biosynthesis protein [Bryobacterales bacterium F-183]|nr:enediyne biosynthesis protein [Bryobacterales bacterium F-183]
MRISLARRAFGIADREVTFAARGFESASITNQERLERVGRTFVIGYHASLEIPMRRLAASLDEVPDSMRGFAYEGAAMGLAILDSVMPLRRRLSGWLRGPGAPHNYMTFVGAGWACARIPWQRRRVERSARRFHSFLWPLVMDGYGFHEGYFRASHLDHPSSREGVESEHGMRSYYQGLGRSLWFVCGADPWKIADRVQHLPPHRTTQLWSGVGLACGYAGGMTSEELRILMRLADVHKGALRQGVCFAVKARQQAGNPTGHTDAACATLCGISPGQAVEIVDQALVQTRTLGGNYCDWVRIVQERLSSPASPMVSTLQGKLRTR